MSIELITRVLHHSQADATALNILIGIATHAGPGGSYPSIATLAKYGRCSERHVQRCLSKLVERGELVVDKQAGGSKGMPEHLRTNRYKIILECPNECDKTLNHRVDGNEKTYFDGTSEVEELPVHAASSPENTPEEGVTYTSPDDLHVTGGVTYTSPGGRPTRHRGGDLHVTPETYLETYLETDVERCTREMEKSDATANTTSQRNDDQKIDPTNLTPKKQYHLAMTLIEKHYLPNASTLRDKRPAGNIVVDAIRAGVKITNLVDALTLIAKQDSPVTANTLNAALKGNQLPKHEDEQEQRRLANGGLMADRKFDRSEYYEDVSPEAEAARKAELETSPLTF